MDDKWTATVSTQITALQSSMEQRLAQLHNDISDLRRELYNKLDLHDDRVNAHTEKMKEDIERIRLENNQTKTRVVILVLIASSGSHGLVNLVSSFF